MKWQALRNLGWPCRAPFYARALCEARVCRVRWSAAPFTFLPGFCHEAYLSAFRRSPQAHPWVSCPHENPRRPVRDQRASLQGPQASRRLKHEPGSPRNPDDPSLVAAATTGMSEPPASAQSAPVPSGVAVDAQAQGLPPRARVRTAAQYQAVLRRGKRVGRSTHFVLMYLPPAGVAEPTGAAPADEARLGLIVGKRNAARAVTRNAVKRVWRETFRLQRATLPAGDYVVRLALKLPDLTLGTLKRQVRTEADTLLRHVRRSGRPDGVSARPPARRSPKPSP